MANARDIGRQLMSDLKRDFGLTDAQAAGVVGNLLHESANFGSMQEVNPQSGRGGYGYAQWTGSRRREFENYVQRNGLDPSSYDANYGFLKHEIETVPYERRQFNKVRQAKTAAEAARIVSKEYLRPGIAHNERRVRLAKDALSLRSGPPGEPATMSAGLRAPSGGSALAAIDSAAPSNSPSAFGYAPNPGPRAPMAVAPASTRGRPPLISRNAGDSLALSPVMGSGTSPMFDGVYDPRVDAVMKNTPRANWGMSVNRSAPPMPTRAAQSYAGQDRAPPRHVAPGPAQQSSQLLGARTAASRPETQAAVNAAAAASRPRARLPDLPPSTLGRAPTTRTVTSVPVSTPPLPRSRPNTTAVVASLPTGPAPATMTPIQRAAMTYANGGPTRPATAKPAVAQPAGSINPNKQQARLAPSNPAIAVAGAPLPASARPGAQVASVAPIVAPTPLPASARPTAVGTQMAVTPPPVAPTPFSRPNFGMGGAEPPNVLDQIGGHLMNNTLPGRAIGGAGWGIENLAAGRPLLGNTAQQGASLQAIGNTLMDHTGPGRLFGMLTGQRPNPVQSLVSFLQPQRANPVGSLLGIAANGGRMIQGVNGIQNSITQNSDYWRQATGQDSNGSERRREASRNSGGRDASRGDHGWND